MVEIDWSRARLHYVVYNNSNDEWCEHSELVTIPVGSRNPNDNAGKVPAYNLPIQPFSLYNELRIKIKQALVCHTEKTSPSVVIDKGFNYLLFKGGLQAVGIAKKKPMVRGVSRIL